VTKLNTEPEIRGQRDFPPLTGGNYGARIAYGVINTD